MPAEQTWNPADASGRLPTLSARDWLVLAGLIVAALAFGFLRGAHFANVAAGVGYADGYWTQFWLTSYQDGYARRSLLGSVLSLVLPAGSSVALLSALQLAISAALLATGMAMLMRLMGAVASLRDAALCTALLGFSPIAPTLFETTGDPLQAAMLAWLAGVLGAARLREGARLGVLVAISIVAMLIHEAMAFFVLPHLLLTAPRLRALPIRARAILTVVLVALAAAAIGLLTSSSAGVPRYFLSNTLDRGPILADKLATPGFAEVFRTEMAESFRTPVEGLRRLARVFCFPVVPLALIAFWATFARARVQLALLFAVWLVCAAPLFVIAHDWGRFGVLGLWLVLASTLADGARLNLGRGGATAERAWQAVSQRLMRSPREVRIVRMILAMVILASSVVWQDYRIAGGRMSLFLAVPAVLVAVAIAIKRGRAGRSARVA